MVNRFVVAIVCFLAISCSQAVELPVEHSLDGGITFKRAGFIDGNFKVSAGVCLSVHGVACSHLGCHACTCS